MLAAFPVASAFTYLSVLSPLAAYKKTLMFQRDYYLYLPSKHSLFAIPIEIISFSIFCGLITPPFLSLAIYSV